MRLDFDPIHHDILGLRDLPAVYFELFADASLNAIAAHLDVILPEPHANELSLTDVVGVSLHDCVVACTAHKFYQQIRPCIAFVRKYDPHVHVAAAGHRSARGTTSQLCLATSDG